mmetsp:Transcript_2955/g.4758  ORF Transcript_2955/g.4758 Transcript_2955/m.4758 type:complete len:165 (-) Transcript_2955:128-622(-)
MGLPPDFVVEPRAVAARDLDSLIFSVLVLKVNGEEADVLYLDDMNIEREVPLEELGAPTPGERRPSDDELATLYVEGLAALAAGEEEDANTRPTTADTSMRWEQGRFVADDGSVILSSGAGVLGFEDLKGKMEMGIEVPACGAGLRGIRHLRKNRHAPQAPVAA